MVGMSILLFCTVESEGPFTFKSGWTTAAFLAGSITSIVAGYIGMMVAVYANARVALAA
jgi:Na+/H+-translocating membrane pyrophosphatase